MAFPICNHCEAEFRVWDPRTRLRYLITHEKDGQFLFDALDEWYHDDTRTL